MPDIQPNLAPDDRVVVEDPAHMNLLGLLMRGLLSESLRDDARYAAAKSLRGDVAVRAGTMAVTLRFGDGRLTIVRGASPSARASVAGTMTALLGVVLRQGMVRAFFSGKLRIGGNPLVLLRILPLIREPQVREPQVREPQAGETR